MATSSTASSLSLSLSVSFLCLLGMCIASGFQLSLCSHHFMHPHHSAGNQHQVLPLSRYCMLNAITILILSVSHAFLYFSLSVSNIKLGGPSDGSFSRGAGAGAGAGARVGHAANISAAAPNNYTHPHPPLSFSSVSSPASSSSLPVSSSNKNNLLTTTSTLLTQVVEDEEHSPITRPLLNNSNNNNTSPHFPSTLPSSPPAHLSSSLMSTTNNCNTTPTTYKSPMSPKLLLINQCSNAPPLPSKEESAFILLVKNSYASHPALPLLSQSTIIDFYRGHALSRGEPFALSKLAFTLDWYIDYGMRTLLDENFEEFIEQRKFYISGFSKDGYPIIIFRTSNHYAGDNVLNVRFMVYMIEKWKRQGLLTHKINIIVDRLDFTSKNQDDGIVKCIADIFQHHYPEKLARLFIIPRTLLLNIAWKIIRLFLDPITVSKVFILGNDYLPTLLLHMDADQIVERMGGTMVDVTEEEGYTDMELAFLDNNADEEEKEDALLVRTAVEHGVVSACDSPSRKTTLKTIAAAGLKEEWGEVAESSTPSPTTSSPSSHPDDDNDEIFQSAISLEQQQEPQHNNNNNGKSIKNDDRHPPPLPQQQKTAKKPAAFRTLSEIDSEIDRIVASSITASSGGSGGGNGGFWGRRESSSSSSSSAAAEHSSSPNPCSGKFMCTK